jgi:hypothetical protein
MDELDVVGGGVLPDSAGGSAPPNYWYHILGALLHFSFAAFYLSSGIALCMSRTCSSSAITCQNRAFQFFQLEDGRDLVKNGKNCAGNQQYFCKHCWKYFVETKNTSRALPI